MEGTASAIAKPMMYASFPDRGGEHWAEPIAPVTNRLVADIDAPLEQDIFYLTKRQRIADIHHNHEADYLGRSIEITEGISHPTTLRKALSALKQFCSDKAQLRAK